MCPMRPDEAATCRGWVTKSELATHLKMTTRWIETQQRLGMPFLPCGMANRYKIVEVEAWIREYYRDRRRGPAGKVGRSDPVQTSGRA
jgi:hypothetical protein